METWTEYGRFVIALLAIMDPFAAVPIFLSLTGGHTLAQKRRTAHITGLTVFLVLVIAAFSGEFILKLLGASLDAFRVGGGIILLLMALSMLNAQVGAIRQTPEEADDAAIREEVGAVPLGIPLLAGPGAISATIIQTQQSSEPLHLAAIVFCIALICAVAWAALLLAAPLARRISVTGFNIMTRLLGVLVAAVAVQLMASGMLGLFPALAG